MARGRQLDQRQAIVLGERRQALLLGVVALPVVALHVDPLESGKRDDRPADGELRIATGRRPGTQAKRHRFADGVRHLRGDGALPDQLIEPGFGSAELAGQPLGGPEGVTGGTDGLVRLLGRLRLGHVAARHVRDVVGAVAVGDLGTSSSEGRVRQRGAVGSHVSDVAALVEPLCRSHGLGRRHAQLPPGLLLEGGGHERRGGAASVGLALDRAHDELGAFEVGRQVAGGGLVEHHHIGAGRLAVLAEVAPGGQPASV